MADLGDYGGESGYGGGSASGSDVGTTGPDAAGYSGDSFGLDAIDIGGPMGYAAFDPMGMGMGDIGIGSESYSDAGAGYGPGMGTGLSFEEVLGRIPAPVRALAQFGLTRANPALGTVTSMANKAATAGKSPAGAGSVFGSTIGGTLGSMVGGPLGGLVGGALGGRAGASALGGVTGYSGPTAGPGAGEGRGGMDLMTGGLGLLGTLYANSQNSKGIGRQMSTLQDMYGQNSPYAQQLRQQLERRDAAAGRRSQYGPREVELQAALAGQYSRNAPTLMNLQQMRMQQRNQTLAQLAGLYQQMGGMQGIRGGLNDLFGGNSFDTYDTGGMGMQDIGTGSENYFDPVYGES